MTLFDEPSRKPLPKVPDRDELRHVALKAIAGLVPGGSELVGLLTSPLAQRRDDWFDDLERRLRALESRVEGFRFEDLAANNQFVSATLIATQAALKTHQQEKLEALRNAVLNVAVRSGPDEYLQIFFLNLIDTFTVVHLQLLEHFRLQGSVRILDAPGWLKSNIASQVARDLLDRGMLGPLSSVQAPDRDQLIVGRDGVYTFHAGVTYLGNEFLSFIKEPEVTK